MRTLDEVIRAFEYTYENDPIAWTYGVDALHYLKEYKRISAKLEKIALGNIAETLEKLDNPALTWEELKLMEGKPVWLEYDNNGIETLSYPRQWVIISLIDNTTVMPEISFVSKWKTFWMQKEFMGKHWNAYKKEKNN